MKSYDDLKSHLLSHKYNWLVTGAAGFIGTNLCLRLLDLKQSVIGIDNFVTGQKSNIEIMDRLGGDWQFVETDISTTNSNMLKNTDFVLHQAAIGSVPRSVTDPISSHDSNVNGFIQILNNFQYTKKKKFVYASSSSVYGDDTHLPKVESLTGEALSPYAATKKINEIYARVFYRCYNTPVVGLRYFNVFGPLQNPNGPYAAVIPLWIKSALDGKIIYINGDGSYSRDFCYIENVLQANLLAAFSPDTCNGNVYNIAVGEQTTLKILAHYINELVSKKLHRASKIEHRAARENDIVSSVANISQARSELGYVPSVSLKEGLELTIEFSIERLGIKP